MTIRTMTRADAAAVAALHTATLQGMLSELGTPIATAFYRAAPRVESTVAVVAESEGVVGVAFGTVEAAGYYRRVALAAPLAVGARLAWRLMIDPALRGRLGQGRNFQGPELLFLAVAESHRGRGIGGRLMRGFEDRLRDRRIDHYALSVESDNDQAVAVYEHHGLEAVDRFEEFGLARTRYLKRLQAVDTQ